MNRAQKEAFVSKFEEGVQKAQAFAIMSFSNLSVEQMTSFRLALRKKEVHVKVVKNTLAKRVFKDGAFADVTKHLTGPTLVAYSAGDPVITAKAIQEWADKENFNVKIKTGAALGQVMSSDQLKALSKLPGKNELFVGFLWALKSGPTKFLYALQDSPRRLGYALNALKEKKASESAA